MTINNEMVRLSNYIWVGIYTRFYLLIFLICLSVFERKGFCFIREESFRRACSLHFHPVALKKGLRFPTNISFLYCDSSSHLL